MCQNWSFWKHKRIVRDFKFQLKKSSVVVAKQMKPILLSLYWAYHVISAAIFEPILLSSNWAMHRLWKASWCHPKTTFFPLLYWKHKTSVRGLNQQLQTYTVPYVAKIGPKHMSSNCVMRCLLNSSWLSHNMISQPLFFIEITLLPCCVFFRSW